MQLFCGSIYSYFQWHNQHFILGTAMTVEYFLRGSKKRKYEE